MNHLTTRYLSWRALRDDESGQGAVEYVGIVIVVVAIIAVVVGFSEEIGDAIGTGLQNIVQNFVGDGG